MGDILDRLEEYMGPYIWGNYTILVLPKSYSYQGMENPLLPFVSMGMMEGD